MKAVALSEEYAALLLREQKMPAVYGPVQSRRFGYSLGVNLLGEGKKACSFDCAYCDLGKTEVRLNKLKSEIAFPSLEVLARELEEGFSKARLGTEKIKTVLISGNGEPTLHPMFSEIVDLLLQMRAKYLPDTELVLVTNGAHFDSRKVYEAANKLDQRILKVDVGNEKAFKTLNSPLSRSNLSSIIRRARNLKDFVVQAMFVQGAVDNTTTSDLEDWIEVLGLLRPKIVHIQTISRVPASSGLKPLDEDALYTIASKLERRTQIKSLVFP
jgi:wyosine [tRNA(Phe)-imidazoG37] synthetase (radical SAM superfamily)